MSCPNCGANSGQSTSTTENCIIYQNKTACEYCSGDIPVRIEMHSGHDYTYEYKRLVFTPKNSNHRIIHIDCQLDFFNIFGEKVTSSNHTQAFSSDDIYATAHIIYDKSTQIRAFKLRSIRVALKNVAPKTQSQKASAEDCCVAFKIFKVLITLTMFSAVAYFAYSTYMKIK